MAKLIFKTFSHSEWKDKWITKIELHANSRRNFNAAARAAQTQFQRDTKIYIIRFIAGRRAAAAALSGGIIFPRYF